MCLPRIDPDSHDNFLQNGLGPIPAFKPATHRLRTLDWPRAGVVVAILAWLNGHVAVSLTIHDKVVQPQFSDALQYPFGLWGSFASLFGGSLSVLLVMLLGYNLRKSFLFCIKAVFCFRECPFSGGVAYARSLRWTYYVLLLMVAVCWTLAETGG